MGPRTRRWALAPAEETELWTANTLSGWLTTAYTATLCLPPAGFAWKSHSLRKGVASAAYAIGARLTDIRYAEVGPPTPRSSRRSTLTSP